MSMTRTTYSPKLRSALDDLRPAFKDVGHGLDQLTRKRAGIAPAFLKAFTLWRRETHRGFLAFVQAVDPTVPADRKGYRAHASYRAAEYVKQLATQPEQKVPKGMTALAFVAVTIKSFLPLCGSQRDQKEALQVLLEATKWREAEQRRLLVRIRRARAVGLPKVPRLVEASKATKAVVVAFEREQLAS